MQPIVVTILSTNFAGSHYLSLLLGSHPQAFHLGEIYRWRRRAGLGPARCRHCVPRERCALFRNIRRDNLESVYQTIFSNLREDDTPKDLLVDPSKKVSWAQRFITDKTVRHKYIHLIRDPRALTRRWLLTYKSVKESLHVRRKVSLRGDRLRPDLLVAPQWKVCAFKWLNQNIEIANFLGEHRLDYQVVTYGDLATNTLGELERLMRWLGLEAEPGQLEYWNVQHHGDEKPEYEWVKQQRKTGHIDLRWKDFLAPAIRDSVIRDAEISAFLSRQALRATENGLTRYAPSPFVLPNGSQRAA